MYLDAGIRYSLNRSGRLSEFGFTSQPGAGKGLRSHVERNDRQGPMSCPYEADSSVRDIGRQKPETCQAVGWFRPSGLNRSSRARGVRALGVRALEVSTFGARGCGVNRFSVRTRSLDWNEAEGRVSTGVEHAARGGKRARGVATFRTRKTRTIAPGHAQDHGFGAVE